MGCLANLLDGSPIGGFSHSSDVLPITTHFDPVSFADALYVLPT